MAGHGPTRQPAGREGPGDLRRELAPAPQLQRGVGPRGHGQHPQLRLRQHAGLHAEAGREHRRRGPPAGRERRRRRHEQGPR
ncbi:MAG: hypothetical protein ACK559_19340, partial [bacterium]